MKIVRAQACAGRGGQVANVLCGHDRVVRLSIGRIIWPGQLRPQAAGRVGRRRPTGDAHPAALV